MHLSPSLKIGFSTSTVRLFTTSLSAFLTYDRMQCIVIRSVLDGKHANCKLYTIYGANAVINYHHSGAKVRHFPAHRSFNQLSVKQSLYLTVRMFG